MNDITPAPDTGSPQARREELLVILRQGRRQHWLLRWGVSIGILGSLLGGGIHWQRRHSAPRPMQFETKQVSKGNLRETVTATGILKPVDSLQIGAEVTGRLVKVTVNVNDHVEQGQVLAEIDPEQLESRTQETRAQLSGAQASERSAQASLAEAELQERRLQTLFDRGLASAQERETAQATAARAKASVASAAAQITVARAGLVSAQTSLRRAVIVAPMSGIVLVRAVEPGQTVTAGFQTPVLFTLARDITQLKLEVEVAEADIGQVSEGQTATFTVDAYPKRVFESKLVKLHNMPTVAAAGTAVVTYSATLTVSNGDRLLRPGMTATATITTRTLKDVVLVPNVALRFDPPRSEEGSGGPFSFFGRGSGNGGPEGPASVASDPEARERRDHVWLIENGVPEAMPVEVLGTDGRSSAVKSFGQPPLTENRAVLVDIVAEPDP